MSEGPTEFIKRNASKHGQTVGGMTLAAAIVWLYTHFVSVQQYKQDQADQKAINSALWKAVQEKGK